MNSTRRSFLKKAVYVAPAVMTMTALPAIASNGSEINDTTPVAQPAVSWQSKARRNRLRRLEKKGEQVERFSNWENANW